MGRQVYVEDNFKIYRAGNDYIVHNTEFEFSKKHTHVKNLKAAKEIIYSVKKRVIPRGFSEYLLKSIIRVSDDELYIKAVEDLIEVRSQKGKKLKYTNHRIA